MLESATERECRDIAREHGCFLLKLSPFGMAGVPDRMLICPGGKLIFIEFKQLHRYPRRLQRYWLETLKALGFSTYVFRTVGDFRLLLKALDLPVIRRHTPSDTDNGGRYDPAQASNLDPGERPGPVAPRHQQLDAGRQVRRGGSRRA